MQSNALVQAFSYGTKPVRMTSIDGEPWFAAKDVCDVLGYANDSDAIKKHCKEKGVAKRDSLTEGGTQSITFINEPNLYRLVVRSRKPEAAQFESWVMEEVLPQIRKTGSYSTPLGIDSDPILASLGAIREMRLSQLRLEERVESVDQRLTNLEHDREAAKEAIEALPAPSVVVRDLTTRETCREAVNTLVSLTGKSHHDTWNRIYAKFDLVHRTCLTKKAKGTTKIDWLDANNRLGDLYAIISKFIAQAKQAA